jgi:hypothetical protein
MLGFDEAGGFVKESFWEYAPVGRVHLYPPLLHFLMLALYKLGFSALSIARFFEFIIYPLLLFIIYKVISRLFSERLAFFSLLAGSSVYSFYLSAINFIPASIALILGLLTYLFIENRKIVTSVILLSLSFYVHPGIPWFFTGSIILYGIFNRKRLRDSLLTVIYALILSGPILIYEYIFRRYIALWGVYENFLLEFNLWVLLAAIPGIFIVLRKKGKHHIFLSLLLMGIFMLLTKYKYRYLCGHGILGAIFLCALSLDAIYEKFSNYLFNRKKNYLYLRVLFIIIVILFFAVAPSIQFQGGHLRFVVMSSTYMNFVPNYYNFQRGNEITIYFAEFWEEIAQIVENNSSVDDIIYCNMPYSAGVISILSKRASSTAMLQEIKPFRIFDPIIYSRLVIWIKNPEGIFDKRLSLAIRKYSLEKIAETQIAYIYKNPLARGRKKEIKAVVSNWTVYSILFILAAVIIWDNKIRKISSNA